MLWAPKVPLPGLLFQLDSNAQRSPRGMRKCDVDIRRDLGAKDVLPGIGLVLQRFSDSTVREALEWVPSGAVVLLPEHEASVCVCERGQDDQCRIELAADFCKCVNDVEDISFRCRLDVVEIHVTTAKLLISVDVLGVWPSRSRVDDDVH